MTEDHLTRQLFRQAQSFERLKSAFEVGRPTERELVMARVCKGMAEVCMMLADVRQREES